MVSSRSWFALAVAGVLAMCYVGYGLYENTSGFHLSSVAAGQERPPTTDATRRAPGRYQMAVRDGADAGARPYVLVCDTATGQCWSMQLIGERDQRWRDLGSPQTAKAADADAAIVDEKKELVPAADVPPRLSPKPQ